MNQTEDSIRILTEYAGGEERPVSEEESQTFSPAALGPRSPSLPDPANPITNLNPFGNNFAPTDLYGANVHLRRFSHPTAPVAPLISGDSLPPPQNRYFTQDSGLSSDPGPQQVGAAISHVGMSAVNLLEFYRTKLIELENHVVSLASQCAFDSSLLQETADKVGKIFRILEAAAASSSPTSEDSIALVCSPIDVLLPRFLSVHA